MKFWQRNWFWICSQIQKNHHYYLFRKWQQIGDNISSPNLVTKHPYSWPKGWVFVPPLYPQIFFCPMVVANHHSLQHSLSGYEPSNLSFRGPFRSIILTLFEELFKTFLGAFWHFKEEILRALYIVPNEDQTFTFWLGSLLMQLVLGVWSLRFLLFKLWFLASSHAFI